MKNSGSDLTVEEKTGSVKQRYQDGQFTETVFRASLYAIGLRGADIDQTVRDTTPPQRRVP